MQGRDFALLASAKFTINFWNPWVPEHYISNLLFVYIYMCLSNNVEVM